MSTAESGHGEGSFFFLGDDGRPTRRGHRDAAPYVYTGAQIIRPEVFDGAPPGAFSLNVVWDRLLDEGRLYGAVHLGEWVDVGTPEGLRLADAALAE